MYACVDTYVGLCLLLQPCMVALIRNEPTDAQVFTLRHIPPSASLASLAALKAQFAKRRPARLGIQISI